MPVFSSWVEAEEEMGTWKVLHPDLLQGSELRPLMLSSAKKLSSFSLWELGQLLPMAISTKWDSSQSGQPCNKKNKDAAGYEAGELIFVLWRLDCCAVVEILVLSMCSLFRTRILSEGFKTWKLVLPLTLRVPFIKRDLWGWTPLFGQRTFVFLNKLFFYFGKEKNWSK